MSEDNLIFYEQNKRNDKVAFFGVPIDLGKDNHGSDSGPDYLRAQGLAQMFKDLGKEAEDLGNIKCGQSETAERGDPKIKYLKEIMRISQENAVLTHQELSAGKKVVVIGGDQSVSFGTVAGASAFCQGDLGLIWLDAHGDLMTHENTLSGNAHGMPAAVALGIGHPDLVNIFKAGVKIKPENFLAIGLKDLDQDEINLIREKNLSTVTVMDYLQKGFANITKRIDELAEKVKNVWVCLDLDVIDKDDAPATLMGTRGSLNYREITNLAKYIGKKCPVIGLDVAELAPAHDQNGKTAKLALELISYFLGADYSWYARYMKKAANK